jgi:hypothetical protein
MITPEAPLHSQQPNAQYQSMSDEIDLVELLAIAWRLRYATLAGTVIGLAAGLVYSFVRTPSYETTSPVTISADSLPANTDSKKVLEMYTAALGSPEVATAAFFALATNAPDLAQNLKTQNISIADLVRTQTALESVGKPNKSLIQITPSASPADFFITTRLPAKGLGERARLALMSAINAAAKTYNQRETQKFNAQAQGALKEAEENILKSLTKQETKLVNTYATQTRIKSELAQLEYKLQRSSGSEGPSFARLSLNAPVNVVISNSENKVSDPSSRPTIGAADFDRVTRLKAILVSEKRMGEKESNELDTYIARLQMKAQRVRADLDPLISSIEGGRETLATAQRAVMRGLDRSISYLPSFALDSAVTAEEARSVRVEQSPGRTLPIAAGGILGAVLGFMIVAAYQFIRRNQRRLYSLLNGNTE